MSDKVVCLRKGVAMKSNVLQAWLPETSPDSWQEVLDMIRIDAQKQSKPYLESAKVDLGGE